MRFVTWSELKSRSASKFAKDFKVDAIAPVARLAGPKNVVIEPNVIVTGVSPPRVIPSPAPATTVPKPPAKAIHPVVRDALSKAAASEAAERWAAVHVRQESFVFYAARRYDHRSLVSKRAVGHYWARVLGRFGHTVKLIAPQCVKPYVKSNKNDANDAEAICEAVSRPHHLLVESFDLVIEMNEFLVQGGEQPSAEIRQLVRRVLQDQRQAASELTGLSPMAVCVDGS